MRKSGFDLLGEHRDDFPPEFLYWVDKEKGMTALEQIALQEIRTEMYDAVQGVFADHDLLVCPTLTAMQVKNGTDGNTLGPAEVNGVEIDRCIGWCPTYISNYTGHPAASIPAGFADGLPSACRSWDAATPTPTCWPPARRSNGCGRGTTRTRAAPSARCRSRSRMQVVIAEGAPQARGFQVGSALAEQVARSVAAMHGAQSACELSEADLAARLAPLAAASQAALPERVDDLRGLAQGAGVPFADVLAVNALEEVFRERSERCSSLAVAAPGGVLWRTPSSGRPASSAIAQSSSNARATARRGSRRRPSRAVSRSSA